MYTLSRRLIIINYTSVWKYSYSKEVFQNKMLETNNNVCIHNNGYSDSIKHSKIIKKE